MLMSKLKALSAVVLALGFMTTGVVTCPLAAVQTDKPSLAAKQAATLQKQDTLATAKRGIKSAPPAPANEFPVGWGGGGGKDYEIRLDNTVRHAGKASVSIKSIVVTPTWYGAVTQVFRADKYQGRRLRMTAYVKTRDVENAAGLWMRIEGFDGKGRYSVASDLMRTPIKGTNDWKRYEVVLDVPKQEAAQIYFGVMLAGKGQVWADDFAFEVVGNAVKATGRAVERGKTTNTGSRRGLPAEPKNLDFEQSRPESPLSHPTPESPSSPTK